MLLVGATADWKGARGLTQPAEELSYTNQGEVCAVEGLNDADEWNDMFQAMSDVGMDASERDALLDVAAFVMAFGGAARTSSGALFASMHTTARVSVRMRMLGRTFDVIANERQPTIQRRAEAGRKNESARAGASTSACNYTRAHTLTRARSHKNARRHAACSSRGGLAAGGERQ